MKLMYMANAFGPSDNRYILLHPTDDERGISFAMYPSKNEFRRAGRYSGLKFERTPGTYYPFHQLLLKDDYV